MEMFVAFIYLFIFLNVTKVLKGQPSATTHTHEMLNKHNHVDKSKH